MTDDSITQIQKSSFTSQAPSKEVLLQQFDEFFSIASQFNINAMVIPAGNNISFSMFEDEMPLPFKMSSEINTLDQSALKPLQSVGSVADKLMQYLQHQNQKIDLLVSYVVSQQDQEESRYQGTKIGGGGIIFTASSPFSVADILEVKIFLKDEKAAIYCHGFVADIEHTEQGYQHKIVFKHIRDEDRETLVRASLHLQSKQLKQLAANRNQTK